VILDTVILVLGALAATTNADSSTKERYADLVCHAFACQDVQEEEKTEENVFDQSYHIRSEELVVSNLVDDKLKAFAMVSVIVFPISEIFYLYLSLDSFSSFYPAYHFGSSLVIHGLVCE